MWTRITQKREILRQTHQFPPCHDHLVMNCVGGEALLPRDIPMMGAVSTGRVNDTIEGDRHPGRDLDLETSPRIREGDIKGGTVGVGVVEVEVGVGEAEAAVLTIVGVVVAGNCSI